MAASAADRFFLAAAFSALAAATRAFFACNHPPAPPRLNQYTHTLPGHTLQRERAARPTHF
jgi:hypothetical protein